VGGGVGRGVALGGVPIEAGGDGLGDVLLDFGRDAILQELRGGNICQHYPVANDVPHSGGAHTFALHAGVAPEHVPQFAVRGWLQLSMPENESQFFASRVQNCMSASGVHADGASFCCLEPDTDPHAATPIKIQIEACMEPIISWIRGKSISDRDLESRDSSSGAHEQRSVQTGGIFLLALAEDGQRELASTRRVEIRICRSAEADHAPAARSSRTRSSASRKTQRGRSVLTWGSRVSLPSARRPVGGTARPHAPRSHATEDARGAETRSIGLGRAPGSARGHREALAHRWHCSGGGGALKSLGSAAGARCAC